MELSIWRNWIFLNNFFNQLCIAYESTMKKILECVYFVWTHYLVLSAILCIFKVWKHSMDGWMWFHCFKYFTLIEIERSSKIRLNWEMSEKVFQTENYQVLIILQITNIQKNCLKSYRFQRHWNFEKVNFSRQFP